jgi:hypothetical protein
MLSVVTSIVAGVALGLAVLALGLEIGWYIWNRPRVEFSLYQSERGGDGAVGVRIASRGGREVSAECTADEDGHTVHYPFERPLIVGGHRTQREIVKSLNFDGDGQAVMWKGRLTYRPYFFSRFRVLSDSVVVKRREAS